ncbi:MAG: cysteine--tRNA ligase [Oscillospiraceae bacterium]|nr:cysteine--tRNA ligase [Oscillospiraceae bacterium]
MKLYNTLTSQKEEFIPITHGKVSMYVCGPTVYNFAHLGNGRPLVVFDMIRRWLTYRGYAVTYVQNYTDVDDKLIARAAEEGVPMADIAQRFIAEYATDSVGLGVNPADIHPRATENITEMQAMIARLMEANHAYVSDDGVYFDTASFPCYGCLSKMPLDQLEEGERTGDTSHKRNKFDFALWKFAEAGAVGWDSPWGYGRPGWHIECSAMAYRYLGEQIDIHAGGVDLTFPHHENELAQTQALTGKPMAKYWLHNGFINVDHAKMSKSAGNFFTIRQLAEKYGYPALRFFLLSAHYRSPINFDDTAMEQAKSALGRLTTCGDNLAFYISRAGEGRELTSAELAMLAAAEADFGAAMDDDFNTADAIGVLFKLVREVNTLVGAGQLSAAAATILQDRFALLTGLLGLLQKAEESGDGEIDALVAQRDAYKKERNFAEADKIRDRLKEMGILLEDTAQGTKWKLG